MHRHGCGGSAQQLVQGAPVATAGQIILAADLTQRANDSGQLEPMIGAALAELEQAGIEQRPETVLADGRYWNTAQIAALGHQAGSPMKPSDGLEPSTPSLPWKCSTN
ncbi:MAG: hypothetical protein QOC54_424 [Baekduia sp.]|nr:hypothetical protein [Baekduia sp.]